jgi:hypothetical protein
MRVSAPECEPEADMLNAWGNACLAAIWFAIITPPAHSRTWTHLVNQPDFAASTSLLLTDGTVMTQGAGSNAWYRLTPDDTGSYVNGTWSQIASMPASYAPHWETSAVLADGRVIVNGGYVIRNNKNALSRQGAIYDPVANFWSTVPAPPGWRVIGTGPSVVLQDGTYMLGAELTKQQAVLDLTTMTWAPTGSNKADINGSESWALLPGGQILDVDSTNFMDPQNTEILTNGSWAFAGDTPHTLESLLRRRRRGGYLIGGSMLRGDGTVFSVGLSGYTAIYSIASKTWKHGPKFPPYGGSGCCLHHHYDRDILPGSMVLLTSGSILGAVDLSPTEPGTAFYEISLKNILTVAPSTPNAANVGPFQIGLLPLPNGQVLQTDGSSDVEIYTPAGKPEAHLAPKIARFPSTVVPGGTYTLAGFHLNGYSRAAEGSSWNETATNYPLVRITNTATGHVLYARTANHSSMGVAVPGIVTTEVTIPAGIETGASTLVVVANGIASAPQAVTIQ